MEDPYPDPAADGTADYRDCNAHRIRFRLEQLPVAANRDRHQFPAGAHSRYRGAAIQLQRAVESRARSFAGEPHPAPSDIHYISEAHRQIYSALWDKPLILRGGRRLMASSPDWRRKNARKKKGAADCAASDGCREWLRGTR